MHSASFDSKRTIDLIAMGRVAIDLYSEQVGAALENAQSFQKYLGGCAGNIAVGTARQGLKSAMLSCVGTDDMGIYLKNTLRNEGVDISLLTESQQHLTALVLLGVNPPDRFPLIFYRENCADMQITPEQCDKNFFENSKAFLFTGTCLSTDSMRKATHHAINTAKTTKTAIIFDIDYRPVLWKLTASGDGETRFKADQFVSSQYRQVLQDCDVIVGTEEEFMIAGASSDLKKALQVIRQHSKALLVLKTGEKGCQTFSDDLNHAITGQPFPVDVLNVLGAGDAFMSGFLSGWLRKLPLETCAQYANACGAIVVTRHGCAPAIPNYDEMQYFISHYTADYDINNDKELHRLHQHSVIGRAIDQPMLVLAFDHRTQFEDTCQQANKSSTLISQFKQAMFDGFLQVQKNESDAAILVDPQYGRSILKNANDQHITIGVPIEAAGKLPLEWLSEQTVYDIIVKRPQRWFVKVLWQFHINMDEELKQQQLSMLNLLAKVCQSLNRKLMLELITPKQFTHDADAIAKAMKNVYVNNIYPYWWKIAAIETTLEWKKIARTLRKYDPQAAIIILGGTCKHLSDYQTVFKTAKSINNVTGFAVGRSIFWPIWLDFINEKISLQKIPALIAKRYQDLINYWHST